MNLNLTVMGKIKNCDLEFVYVFWTLYMYVIIPLLGDNNYYNENFSIGLDLFCD